MGISKQKLVNIKSTFPIIAIFLLGVALRFLYYPGNIYLGFDQARDIFTALSVLQGDLKLIGPPSSFNGDIFHGPLVYYLYAPVLYFFSGSLLALSFFLRIYNALGILIIFFIGATIFDRRIGFIAAFLFAISYEQSQYALFLGHPVLAVIPVLLFYLGLALLFFKKKMEGLILSLVSLGLAIQFHYVHTLLLFVWALLLLVFTKQLKLFRLKDLLLAFGGFTLAISTFIIAEFKYDFRLTKAAYQQTSFLLSFKYSQTDAGIGLSVLARFIHDNFITHQSIAILTGLVFGIIIYKLLVTKDYKYKAIFLIFWLVGGIMPYVLTKSPSYYYGAGASASLLVLAAFALDKIWIKFPLAAIILVGIVLINNLILITSFNQNGPNLDMVIQPQMFVSDEKKVLDYIYQQSQGKPIAVKALGVPLSVNTTWSYLFEWYGKEKYGYLPTWIGPIAAGYPSNLKVNDSRSDLPREQFLIIEPLLGVREGMKEQFFEEEGYFTKVVEEKEFGQFKVQRRLRF